jgi:trehalose 6-phosphate synthase
LARIVVVSNRVAVPSTDSGARAGGLEVALRSFLRSRHGLWFGWSGRVAPKADIAVRSTEHAGVTYVTTDLSRGDHQEYYNGFANRMLWPILHYRLDLAEFSSRDLGGYMRVNELFAAQLHAVIQPDDIIWVHDYHLFPLAKALRDRGHKNKIGFFLHVPFPPPEILTVLPRHERLILSLCHYDLVGFQTDGDADNLARYLSNECRMPGRDRRTFMAGDRTVRLGVFPVGVEAAQFNRLARRTARSSFVGEVLASLAGRAMIIGVDRLDYSKGIGLRVQAFERFLADHPRWSGAVTYLQITPRSRSEIREYADMERRIGETVGRVNGRYGEASWTPIRYVNRPYSRSALAGLYRSSRAALVTPLRHEPGRQGVRRRAGCRGPGRSDLVAICRRCGRMSGRASGQSLRRRRCWERHRAGARHADRRTARPAERTAQHPVAERPQALGRAIHHQSGSSGGQRTLAAAAQGGHCIAGASHVSTTPLPPLPA